MHLKYVDDMTAAQAFKMKTDLEVDPNRKWPKPAMKRERFEKILPNAKNHAQELLNQLSSYAEENQMKLNKDKTKVMLFNTAKQNDFLPEIVVEGQHLEVVEQFKLLGVIITSDLKWEANTDYITKKAYKRLWMLRRLKNLGLKTDSLVKIYTSQIRSVLEYGSVTWHAMLTKNESKSIERVQKSALAIILGQKYKCYESALSVLSLQRLADRRVSMSAAFAAKSAKHPLHSSWFCKSDTNKQVNTRSEKLTYKPVIARTQRLLNSAIPFMTEQLNVKPN